MRVYPEAIWIWLKWKFAIYRFLCRFLDAGMTNLPCPVAAGVQKAPRHEVAGSLALAVLRALWGFDSGTGLEGGCNTDRMRPADQPTAEIGSV